MRSKRMRPDVGGGWLDQPEGTAQVVFDDGSALVRGDVPAPEIAAVLKYFGVDEPAATEVARVMAEHGLMFAGPDYPYTIVEGKTWSEETFTSIAEHLGSKN